MSSKMTPSHSRALRLAGVLALHALAVQVGLGLTVPELGTSALWLANGIAVIVLVRRSRSVWMPGLAVFATIEITARSVNGWEFDTAVGYASANAVSVFVAMVVLRWMLGTRSTFDRPSGIVGLLCAVGAGAGASTAIGYFGLTPGVGVGPLEHHVGHAALMWFVGRALGMAIVISLYDSWAGPSRRSRLTRGRAIEATIVVVLVVLGGGIGSFVPQVGTLLAIVIRGLRMAGMFITPVRYGRRATATMMALLIYEFAALLVVGSVSVLGVQLVWVGSRDVLVATGVVEAMLWLLTLEAVMLGLAALMADRRRTIEKMAQDEERFRAITESAVDAIVATDPTGTIVFANAAAARMFRVSDLVGGSVGDLVSPPEQVGVLGADLRALQQGLNTEGVAMRVDGSEFPVDSTWWSYETASGQQLVTALFRDMSERARQAEERQRESADLERSNQDLAEFAYIASHDLQEPLRMVASFLHLLSDRYKGKLDDDADQYIGYAMDGAQRLNDLIGDLLAYSRAGTATLDRTVVDLGELFREAVDLLRIQVRETGAKIDLGELAEVHANPSLLGQVVQNLLSNALKFRVEDESPRIKIEMRKTPSGPAVAVIDHGIGIPREQQNNIFQPFRRLHGRDQYPGTGIGLAVCRKVIDRHNGSIWVEPTPGGGTTVLFTVTPAHARSRRKVRGAA